jgi:hypothetical protein
MNYMSQADLKRLRDMQKKQAEIPVPGRVSIDSTPAWEATSEEKARGENQRQAVGEFLNSILPKGGIQYGKYSSKPVSPTLPKNTLLPSPVEEAARRQREVVPSTSIARPEGTAKIQPNTRVVETSPVGTPLAGRISSINPYGADVTSPALNTNQVRVGAGTDAEAARNLQDRALQDQASGAEVQRLNRATEAMRELRAARRGVSVNELDSVQQAAPEVRNPFALPGDAFGDDIMRKNKLMSTIENPQGWLGKTRRANQEAAVKTFNSFMENNNQPIQQKNTTSPLDMGRFLLDQQKAVAQQGLDKARLGIEQGTLASKQMEAGLKQREYTDKTRKEFMETVQLDVPPEYQSQIASDVFQMSQATDGLIPPETMVNEYMNFAKANEIDFEDMKPVDLLKFNEKFMASITSRYGSK